MRWRLKCYWMFTGPVYRLCMFGLLPVGLLLMPILLPMKNYPVVTCMGLMIFVYMEIAAEYWVSGGMARRDGQLEYLKSSAKGVEYIRAALHVGLVRQLSVAFLIFAVYTTFYYLSGIEAAHNIRIVIQVLDVMLSGCFFMVVGIIAVRFVETFQICMGIAGFCVWLMGMTMLVSYLGTWLVFVLMLILCAAVCAVSVWLTVKRVKESYYDKTN